MKPPDNADLVAIWESVRRVEIYEGGVASGKPLGSERALVVERPTELSELADLLRVGGSDGFSCMCLGSLAVVLEAEAGRPLAVLGLHHGRHIRWSEQWDSDAVLARGGSLVQWLESHGVMGPAEEMRAAAEYRRQGEADLADWIANAPPGLGPLAAEIAESARSNGGTPTEAILDKLRSALKAEPGSETEMVRSLLRWFGSGTAKASGFPSHEKVVEDLLVQFETEMIVEVVHLADERAVRGALRLFASWARRDRRDELRLLAPEVRAALLAAGEESTDPDTWSRADRVLSG